jgi:hypothetical protein
VEQGANVVVIPYEIVNESGEVEVELNGESLNEKVRGHQAGQAVKLLSLHPFPFKV